MAKILDAVVFGAAVYMLILVAHLIQVIALWESL